MRELADKNTVNIHITGPAGTGKSIIMNRIYEVLTTEFGANVVSDDLMFERRLTDFTKLETWELNCVKNTTWVLHESCLPYLPHRKTNG